MRPLNLPVDEAILRKQKRNTTKMRKCNGQIFHEILFDAHRASSAKSFSLSARKFRVFLLALAMFMIRLNLQFV